MHSSSHRLIVLRPNMIVLHRRLCPKSTGDSPVPGSYEEFDFESGDLKRARDSNQEKNQRGVLVCIAYR